MHLAASAVIVTALFGAGGVYAAPKVSATLGLGMGYDSNVSVEEIDSQSGTGDRLRSTDAQIDVTDTWNGITGTLTYAIADADFEEFDTVSRETRTWGASLETTTANLRWGASYFSADADLGGERFLTYERLSPHISGFISRRWYLRGAWVDSDKSIIDRPGRSATSQALEIDSYYFWRGLRRYFNVGYSYEEEDSAANRFDYNAHLFKLRMIQRFRMNDTLGTIELGARYETRDYTAITPQIRARRDDQRIRLRAEIDIPLQENIFWKVYARYGNYISNLDAVDYEEAVIGAQIELRF